MNKFSFLFFIALVSATTFAQRAEKLDEYTASNGTTYKVGDEITLGRGSDTDGSFVYVKMGGWAVMSMTPEELRLPAANANLIVTIKKIKKYDTKRLRGIQFTVGGGNITNYTMDIENAIATCEIKDCKEEGTVANATLPDRYDQLAKLKKLYDDGVLTEEEYEIEKEKILKN